MLAMPKFTSGKWKVEMVYGDYPIVTADGRIVADCFNNEANACLIAAAPEMYDTLDRVHKILYRFDKEGIIDVVDLASIVRENALLLNRINAEEGEE